jgi:hypothetical protein
MTQKRRWVSPNITRVRCLTCKHAVASNVCLPVGQVEGFIDQHEGHDVRLQHVLGGCWFDIEGKAVEAPPRAPRRREPAIEVAKKALQKGTS